MHNFTYWTQHLFDQAFLGYNLALGFLFYPIMFTAILGYIYLKNQSVVVLAAAILIFVVAFGNTIFGVGIWGTILHIIVSLAFSALLLLFISRRGGG